MSVRDGRCAEHGERRCERDGRAPREHVHDVSCAFGNPQCPLFGEPEPLPPGWIHRILDALRRLR